MTHHLSAAAKYVGDFSSPTAVLSIFKINTSSTARINTQWQAIKTDIDHSKK
ncbi:MAG: hypothetical protein AAFY72_12250 [Cyanobacteria bacterium J06649_4]